MQKKIDELLETSNKMIATLQLQTSAQKNQATPPNTDKIMHVCKYCKKRTSHQDDDCYLEKNKDKRPQWYDKILDKQAKTKAKKVRKLNYWV